MSIFSGFSGADNSQVPGAAVDLVQGDLFSGASGQHRCKTTVDRAMARYQSDDVPVDATQMPNGATTHPNASLVRPTDEKFLSVPVGEVHVPIEEVFNSNGKPAIRASHHGTTIKAVVPMHLRDAAQYVQPGWIAVVQRPQHTMGFRDLQWNWQVLRFGPPSDPFPTVDLPPDCPRNFDGPQAEAEHRRGLSEFDQLVADRVAARYFEVLISD